MITARPIRFTDDLPAWRELLGAVGATTVSDADGWTVYAVGSGRLALHAASEEWPNGLTTLGFEVDDLDAWAASAAEAGAPVVVGEAAHGRAGTVTAGDGTTFTVDPAETARDEAPADPALMVLPIWYTPQSEEARRILGTLGIRERITGDNGVWTDLTCDGGGLVAVHRADTVGVELGFEYAGDIEALIPLVERSGRTPALIDESHNRTLRIPDPDRPDRDLWVNEEQRDLYGYRVVGG
ncbi:hypothetical protein [Ornithinicoccus hortensis]|uniref:VOC domain-containing protein n=1 Tax=Ornithinicoccus hortensis TaxID=82346 RepID=A0A542YMF6_9MICO|nr:hypothetical protein [Ornithinicoccus hortensis]TQL49144.1 hypothetical protein FB467_0209 [Ornithinicoccus hortensis]